MPPTDDFCDDQQRPERAGQKDLHPVVYGAIGVMVLWFALAVWEFAGEGHADYLLAIVSGFVLVAAAIPWILWHVGKRRDAPGTKHENDAGHVPDRSFREWASADFLTWTGRQRARSAAIEALLPLSVAAFGMTLFGLIFHIAAHYPIHGS